MAMLLPLTVDELLTTTRAVRKRLDFTRPVEREVILDCLAIAQQAPTASNMRNWHFGTAVWRASRRSSFGPAHAVPRTAASWIFHWPSGLKLGRPARKLNCRRSIGLEIG